MATDPQDVDSDGDSLTDHDEADLFGTDDLAANTDGDEFSDAEGIRDHRHRPVRSRQPAGPVSAAKARPEESWTPARLIPVSGIRSTKEQEQRATSAVLSVMAVVPSFGKAILRYLKAPAGEISTFTEVRFKDDDGATLIPDGAIVVERGRTRWVCLVEVKTGSSSLRADQADKYLQVAGRENID
ncbi:MAG: hypothetical protein Q8Q52_08020, partial [Acidimicrobiia bacterium]|nr:hypothetical protein [Acidimicrobiia bacterium]